MKIQYQDYCICIYSSFSQALKIGNIGNNDNFVFPYTCNFLLYLHHMMWIVNEKLDAAE